MNQRLLAIGLMLMFATFSANNAHAQIETLVMPGELIEGHAEVETECSSCHLAFERGKQPELCLACHEDVASDIDGKIGFHGLFEKAREENCANCHADHKGRDADVVNLDEGGFDHDFTDFPLQSGHASVGCVDCHDEGVKHREAPQECFSCHEPDNVHGEFVGTGCDGCHESTTWDDITFDHDTTDFRLIGHHVDVACGDCHEVETFEDTPSTCFGCHVEDDVHNGRSGEDCGNCHSPLDWSDTSFDHDRDTRFLLAGRHKELVCDDCHSADPFEETLDMGCVSCHLEDDNHDDHFGDSCDTCHVPDDWEMVTFDHDRDTEYVLLGGHLTIECNDCHIEPIFEVTLATSCDSCHLDDDPHEGSVGTECAACHTEAKWEDPLFFDHDLTFFPLLGKHADNECEDCHESQAFKSTESACNTCHADEDPHRGNFPERCDSCHNPVAWDRWLFDHDIQTAFPLAGAHVGVACADCHRNSLEKMKAVDGSCGSCHRSDDVHDGEFGFDCGRCHSDVSFKEVRSLQ